MSGLMKLRSVVLLLVWAVVVKVLAKVNIESVNVNTLESENILLEIIICVCVYLCLNTFCFVLSLTDRL